MTNPNDNRPRQPQDDPADVGGRGGAAGGNMQRPERSPDQDGKPQQGQQERKGTGPQNERDISESDDDVSGDSSNRTPGREQD